MLIRELVDGDVEQLVALFAAVLPGSPTAHVDRLDGPESFLRDSHSFSLGAYVDGTPVGLAWGVQMRSPSGRLTTYLHELDVHENWRRQGVGSALVTEAMNLARARGSTKFWLSTGGHNEPAQALYESIKGDRKPLGDVELLVGPGVNMGAKMLTLALDVDGVLLDPDRNGDGHWTNELTAQFASIRVTAPTRAKHRCPRGFGVQCAP